MPLPRSNTQREDHGLATSHSTPRLTIQARMLQHQAGVQHASLISRDGKVWCLSTPLNPRSRTLASSRATYPRTRLSSHRQRRAWGGAVGGSVGRLGCAMRPGRTALRCASLRRLFQRAPRRGQAAFRELASSGLWNSVALRSTISVAGTFPTPYPFSSCSVLRATAVRKCGFSVRTPSVVQSASWQQLLSCASQPAELHIVWRSDLPRSADCESGNATMASFAAFLQGRLRLQHMMRSGARGRSVG